MIRDTGSTRLAIMLLRIFVDLSIRYVLTTSVDFREWIIVLDRTWWSQITESGRFRGRHGRD